ncbi:MAG: hypothetical protein CME30_01895 [Gemmatimonadetes bacterium]|nr:hypothetical protein [Gemmatimonadota bacterium]
MIGGYGNWRDHASIALLRKFLTTREIEGRILCVLSSTAILEGVLPSPPEQIYGWARTAGDGSKPWLWPQKDHYDAAILRLPKAKRDLEMCSHLAFSSLQAGCPLWVYGANDEGIRSAEKSLSLLTESVTTAAYGGRCRVLEAITSSGANFKGELSDWESWIKVDLPSLKRDWVSYPGVFADGRVDAGTEVLINALPKIPKNSKALDFGCGSGLVGGAISLKEKSVRVDFLDVDLLALEAVKKNIPGAKVIASDGYSKLDGSQYDLIVSNPPYHQGKSWSEDFIRAMVVNGVSHLNADGKLVFVVQRRLQLEGLLSSCFNTVEVLADRGVYRVWSATL